MNATKNRLHLAGALIIALFLTLIGSIANADHSGQFIVFFGNESNSEPASIGSASTSSAPNSTNVPLLDVRITKIGDAKETTYYESNVSSLSDISVDVVPGTYKIYIQNLSDGNIQEYNNDSTGYTIESGQIMPLEYKHAAGYILDVPWRVESSSETIPILAIAYDLTAPYINNISVYDANANDSLVLSTNWVAPQPINLNNMPYFFSIAVNKSSFAADLQSRLAVKIKFDLALAFDNWEGPIYIRKSEENMPTFKNWFYGDTHVHSNYTSNAWEFGAPVYATSKAAGTIGLGWMTITDHSFDQTNLSTKWDDYLRDCDADERCLRAEEVSCDWGFLGGYSHYLAYGIQTFVSGPETEPGDTDTCETIINNVNSEGFGYVAHPEHEDGLRWKWKNYSLPITGLEAWNSIGEPWEKERDQALEKWVEQLLLGRKIFISAGSDAHGDFNSALGKVRTACFAKNFTKDNIFAAMKNGNCMITDGPLVTFTANRHILGESFNVSEGDAITLNISWNSTTEFGNVTKIFLIRGEIGGSEVNETIITPNNLSGNFIITSTPNNTYYRIEARAIDPDGKTRRSYTNPIWAFAEPKPELEKIPMDETERSLVMAFESKYDYSLAGLFFDGWPAGACQWDELRANLNLSGSWSLIGCDKQILGSRLMWAAFGNPETGEKRIMLQAGRALYLANATQNEYIVNWTGQPFNPGYRNYNWIAEKGGREIFEINEIYSMDLRLSSWGSMDYFGTFLIHGFAQHEGNTTVYYSHWGPEQIPSYNIFNIYMRFDGWMPYPLEYEGFVHSGGDTAKFKRGIFQNRTFGYNASAFGLGADGELDGGDMLHERASFDAESRSTFPVIQGGAIARCYADIDCNDNDLSTRDVCLRPGETYAECSHIIQEIKKTGAPFTEMDAGEISRAIDFKNRHGKPLGELYFDGWANYSCNSAGILDTLQLDGNWSLMQCQKFAINNSLAMFAGLNNTATGKQYAAYQIGSLLVDDDAAYKAETEKFRTNYYPYYYKYLLDRWRAFHNKTQRFEIDVFYATNCNDGYSWCNNPFHYATFILHGFEADGNKNTRVFYSLRGSYSKDQELVSFINILFDNYKSFYFENETSGSKGKEELYQTKLFNYHAVHGWAFGAKDSFNYPANNMSLFSPYSADEMLVELGSPAHIFANDSKGRITGYFNGTFFTEIPGSEILNKTHEKYRIPSGDNYRIRVTGYEDGNYSLKIIVPSGGGGVIYFRNISASAGTVDTFEMNGSGSIRAATKDAEKMVLLEIENTDDPPVSLNFTIAKNKSADIAVSDWSDVSSESIGIKEDINIPPTITITSPQNMTYNKSAVFLNATFGEVVDSAWISIDGKEAQNFAAGASGIEAYTEPLAGGPHSITVFAKSYAEQESSLTAYFSIDTAAPAITIVAPINGTVLPAGTTSVAISIATDESAVCRYGADAGFDYSAGTNFSSTGGMSHSLQYSGLSAGTAYGRYYKCGDAYGNINGMPIYHAFSISLSGDGNSGDNSGNMGSGGGGSNTGNRDKGKEQKDKEKEKQKDRGKDGGKNETGIKKPKNESADKHDGRGEMDFKINRTFKDDETPRENSDGDKITGRIASGRAPIFSKIFAWLRSILSHVF